MEADKIGPAVHLLQTSDQMSTGTCFWSAYWTGSEKTFDLKSQITTSLTDDDSYVLSSS